MSAGTFLAARQTCRRAIYFACVNFFFFSLFFTMSKAISISTGRFSRSFHQMEGICVNFLDQVQFFRFLKGRCHGNQFCGKITYPLHLSLSHSEMEWDVALQIRTFYSSTYCCTSREKMVKIGWVVFELKWGRKWKLCCDSTEIGLYRRISQQLLNHSLPTFQHW